MVLVSPRATSAQDVVRQTIRGEVVDRDSQSPLPGANVVILNTDPLIGSMTDGEGRFVLDDVRVGRHDLRVSFLGFESVTLTQLLVTSGKEVVLRVELKQQVLVGDEIEVVAELRKDDAINDHAFVGARSFSVEETRRYAGGLDDPARMAASFAGVSTGGGIQENAMIIRGNAPKGVSWRLEGIEIPNPNHFAGLSVAGGGGLTLFSSQLLADSDFFTGAFPAEYGNALAGVFDMNFRTGNPAKREHTVQAGVLGVEVASEGPFARDRPSTYLFNYRYSTLGLLLPILPTEDVATYQDLSFKLSFPTRAAGRFDLWGVGGLDGQSMTATEDSTQWEYETWDRLESDLRLNVGAAGLSHRLLLGNRTYLHSAAAVTVNRTFLDQLRMSDELVLRDDLRMLSSEGRLIFGSFLNHKFGARHTNQSGFTVQRLFYDLDVRAALTNGSIPQTVTLSRGTTTLLQAHSQSRFALTTGLSVYAGVHVQSLALTGRTSLEPRFGVRWQVTQDQIFSLGYGLHSQMEDLRIYFARPSGAGESERPNERLDFARAHHAVLGYDRRMGENVRLKLETYYQRLLRVPVIPDSSYSLINFEQDFSFNEAVANEGAGENYGVDLTIERFLRGGYYYLMTGSIFKSRYRGGDGVWRDTRFDRGYAANALIGKEFTFGSDNLLGLNGRLSVMGGKRRSPVDDAASRIREEVIYDETRAFERQEPPLYIVDLTVTYRRNHTRLSEVWALQIQNLFAAKNVSMDFNFQTDAVDEVTEGFPLPVLSYKIEF